MIIERCRLTPAPPDGQGCTTLDAAHRQNGVYAIPEGEYRQILPEGEPSRKPQLKKEDRNEKFCHRYRRSVCHRTVLLIGC